MHEVVVVGLGAMGSATLRALTRQGVDALGIDMHTPPHSLGSSHGHSRVFRTAYFEHPDYVPLLLRARELWDELQREPPRTLFHPTGCLTAGPPDHELIVGVRESVEQHSLPHEVLDAKAVRDRFGLQLSSSDVAVYENEAGLIEPENAIAAMLEGCRTATARVGRIEPLDDHVVVHALHPIRARRVVLATNAWLPQLTDIGPLSVIRQVQTWFRPLAAMDELPCFIHVDGTHAVYGLPPHGDRGVKVCLHGGGDASDPDALDRTLRDDDDTVVREWMRAHLPHANGELEHAAVCMYCMTPDAHFLVGPHPQHERVFLAGGFSGHGFKMAPVIGEALAELVTQGHTRHDVQLFSPRRFGRLERG